MINYFLENWKYKINIYKKQTYYLFTYSVLLSDSRMNPQNYIQPFNKDYLGLYTLHYERLNGYIVYVK